MQPKSSWLYFQLFDKLTTLSLKASLEITKIF